MKLLNKLFKKSESNSKSAESIDECEMSLVNTFKNKYGSDDPYVSLITIKISKYINSSAPEYKQDAILYLFNLLNKLNKFDRITVINLLKSDIDYSEIGELIDDVLGNPRKALFNGNLTKEKYMLIIDAKPELIFTDIKNDYRTYEDVIDLFINRIESISISGSTIDKLLCNWIENYFEYIKPKYSKLLSALICWGRCTDCIDMLLAYRLPINKEDLLKIIFYDPSVALKDPSSTFCEELLQYGIRSIKVIIECQSPNKDIYNDIIYAVWNEDKYCWVANIPIINNYNDKSRTTINCTMDKIEPDYNYGGILRSHFIDNVKNILINLATLYTHGNIVYNPYKLKNHNFELLIYKLDGTVQHLFFS